MINRSVSYMFALAITGFSCQDKVDESFAYSPAIMVFKAEPVQKPATTYSPPANISDGMVYIPGGYTQIGSDEGLDQEKPTFWALVKPFLMDQHEVTVGEFRAFVQATGFKSQAENFGDAGVLNDETREWDLVPGATWQYPHGPKAPKAADNEPVTQVSWNDASAYAKWAGKRLPKEIEWEHAARNGKNDRNLYPFGNELTVHGKALANTWNGTFPKFDAVTDGFHQASPVGTFGKSPLGLVDLSGNVWEWCEDWKMSYQDLLNQTTLKTGPESERVQRGGSYLCEPGWCHGYRVSGRSGSTPETSLMHVGFRCVKDI